jgi:hypothetical protein
VAVPGGLPSVFMALCRLPGEGLSFDTPQINLILQPREIAILLLVNRFAPRVPFSDPIVEATEGADPTELISKSFCQEIRAHFAPSNRRFARRCFGRDALFNLADNGADVLPDLEQVDPVALARAFGAALVSYDKRLAALEQRAKQD